MTTETILTDADAMTIMAEFGEHDTEHGHTRYDKWQALESARAIEKAVLESPEVQALIAENAKLVGLVSEMAENGTYETEYDGRTYEICHGCGAQDGEDHRRPDCVYVRANAAIREQQT